MTTWIALSRNRHLTFGWQSAGGYDFAAARLRVPVLLAELGRLLPHYPLAFVRDHEGCCVVALTGLQEGHSLFVDLNGCWYADYVPASLRGFPFTLARNEAGNLVFAIDSQHLLEDGGDKPLFQENGELVPPVAEILGFLNQCEFNRQQTLKACRALDAAGLIEPWRVAFRPTEGAEPVPVPGLFRVRAQALKTLDGTALEALNQVGALELAHAQLLSTVHFEYLVKRHDMIQAARATSAGVPALEDIFPAEDKFNFDFLDLG